MTPDSKSSLKYLEIDKAIGALPEEVKENSQKNTLPDLIAKISSQKIPSGSLARMWILGSMQARIAVGYLAYAIKSGLVNESQKQSLLNEANLNAAIRLFSTMGYLRGAVMKIGQMLGNLPDVLPREFADILGSLHFEAPPMHFSMVREVFYSELGREPDELFADFDDKAFAAASLGQVHRARLKNGQEVAVKIQYPNIARTIRSDMRNLRALMAPMRFRGEWAFMRDHLEDAERMLKLEADYEREACFLRKAGKIFADFDQIVVPEYYAEYSSPRVLTMDYLPGRHLQEFMGSSPSLDLRNSFGELISIAVLRLSYHSKKYYADPHPGNFLMMDDGRLGFIDFGCYRELSSKEWRMCTDGEKAVFLTCDGKHLDDLIAHGCLHESSDEMDRDRLELVRKMMKWQGEPALEDRPFDFSDSDWYRRGMDLLLETVRQRHSRYAPVWNWINRSIWGHRTLMYRLGCRINFRKLYLENYKVQ